MVRIKAYINEIDLMIITIHFSRSRLVCLGIFVYIDLPCLSRLDFISVLTGGGGVIIYFTISVILYLLFAFHLFLHKSGRIGC